MSIRAPVQIRGGGFGLDAELARKAAERYDYDMEDEARAWLETLSEMQIGDDFGQGLRDGVILCTAANKISPGVVKRVETKSKMPFKLMENVSAFLKGCRVMGVNEFDLFETVDLFELKDLGNVVRCIFALGRAVQRNYPNFKGPTLGVKESSKNQRSFTKDQLADGKNIPAQQTLGSFRTMKRQTTSHTNNVMLGADAAQSGYRAPPPPPPPSAEKIEQLSHFRKANKFKKFESQPEGEMSPTEKHVPTKEEVAATVAELSEEVEASSLNEKNVKSSIPGLNSVAASAGPTAEEEAQEWIEAVLGEKFLADFGDTLKDGVVLCTLMNKIKPGLIPKIQSSSMPFKQMENVSNFVRACRGIGVAEFDLFETVDLYNQKDLGQVANCIHALGRTIQKTTPEYDGPRLGVKESTVNLRQFSDAQLREAATAVPVLAHGSQSVMERRPFDHSASVTFRFDTAATAAAEADKANTGKTSPKLEPKTVEPEVPAQPEPTIPEPEKAETETAPAEPETAEVAAAPEAEVVEKEENAESTGPSWLAQRVASLNSVSSESAAKPNPPVGGSPAKPIAGSPVKANLPVGGSALPTRTLWS